MSIIIGGCEILGTAHSLPALPLVVVKEVGSFKWVVTVSRVMAG